MEYEIRYRIYQYIFFEVLEAKKRHWQQKKKNRMCICIWMQSLVMQQKFMCIIMIITVLGTSVPHATHGTFHKESIYSWEMQVKEMHPFVVCHDSLNQLLTKFHYHSFIWMIYRLMCRGSAQISNMTFVNEIE